MQGVYRHASAATGGDMVFSLFMPPQVERGEPLPVLWYLSGLTCTHANVTEKGEYRAACAEAGIIFIAPDTSPRGRRRARRSRRPMTSGMGAGFYVDATQAPWDRHYKMATYVTEELPALVADHFPIDLGRQGIMRPFDGRAWRADAGAEAARAVPLGRRRSRRSSRRRRCRGGRKPWGSYLGEEGPAWRAHDSVALIEDGARLDELLIDIGEADPFLDKELRPELIEAACRDAGIALRCGATRAMITAIISSPASWPTMSAGTPSACRADRCRGAGTATEENLSELNQLPLVALD